MKIVAFILSVMAIFFLFGCEGGGSQIRDQLANRASLCDKMEPGESGLCTAVAAVEERTGVPVRLEDLDLAIRSGVPLALLLIYDEDEDRTKARDRVLMVIEVLELFLDGEVTYGGFLDKVKLEGRERKIAALVAMETIEELFGNADIVGMLITDTDKVLIREHLKKVRARLALVAEAGERGVA